MKEGTPLSLHGFDRRLLSMLLHRKLASNNIAKQRINPAMPRTREELEQIERQTLAHA
jgi:hypothetical protein